MSGTFALFSSHRRRCNCARRRQHPAAPARHSAALQPLYICAGPPAKATDSLVNGPELMTANHTILPSGRSALTTLFSAGRRRHATCLFRVANAVLAVTIAA